MNQTLTSIITEAEYEEQDNNETNNILRLFEGV